MKETPFYATSGGQEADRGFIRTKDGVFEVEDTIKLLGGKIGHVGHVVKWHAEGRRPCFFGNRSGEKSAFRTESQCYTFIAAGTADGTWHPCGAGGIFCQ